jgi:hypothetical protein
VDEGEAGDQAHVFEVAQPLAVFGGELVAGPVNGFGGVGIEAFEVVFDGAIFVVVAFNDGDVHAANDVEAFFGIGIVADDITQTGDMGAVLSLNVGQNRVERLQIGVYVSDYRVLHSSTSNLPRNFETAKIVAGIFPGDFFAADQTSKTRFTNGLLEPLEFVFQSFGN